MFSVLKWKGRRPPALVELGGLKAVRVSDGSEFHATIGFLHMDARQNPLTGLIQTEVVLPKIPAYDRRGYFTGQETLAKYIDASIAGRVPKRLKWNPKRRKWM